LPPRAKHEITWRPRVTEISIGAVCVRVRVFVCSGTPVGYNKCLYYSLARNPLKPASGQEIFAPRQKKHRFFFCSGVWGDFWWALPFESLYNPLRNDHLRRKVCSEAENPKKIAAGAVNSGPRHRKSTWKYSDRKLWVISGGHSPLNSLTIP
jgi:hypothetical protein